MRSRAVVMLLGVVLAACSEGKKSGAAPAAKPALTLVQSGPRTVDVSIAGPYALRGLQARLTWDGAALRVKRVEPGPEAARLDRVFSSDPAKAEGELRLGATDTRQVLLPARGVLFRLSLEPRAAGGAASTLRLEEPLGAREGGAGVALDATSAEVKIQ